MGDLHQLEEGENVDSRLDSNHTLWRYVSCNTLLEYLRGTVYLSSIAKLNGLDPFEGICPWKGIWFMKGLCNQFGQDYSRVKDWIHTALCRDSERDLIKLNPNNDKIKSEIYRDRYIAFLRKTRFAWCWFQSAGEDALMWTSYAPKGAAIQSSVRRLTKVLKIANKDFAFGKMRYCPVSESLIFDTDRQWDDLITQPYFLKRKEYSGEHEVRFVTAGPEAGCQSGIKLQGVQASQWIDEIRLSPLLNRDEVWMLKKRVAKLSPDIKCKQSELFGSLEEDEDLLPFNGPSMDVTERNSEGAWQDGGDGIPPCVKQVIPGRVTR